tara:strand:- start:43153 stop:43410 length:258 start_codon:yes stop_codon:yes gene_type:complete
MSDGINPDSLPEFSMPANLMNQIYEFSGSSEENKGFILIFADQSGTPQIISQSCSAVIDMGLRKAAEDYLEECSMLTRPDINPGE